MMRAQGIHDRLLHDPVDAFPVSPTHAGADGHRYSRIDDAFAEFLQMIEEAHGGHGLFVTVAAGGRGREIKHAIPARSRTLRRRRELLPLREESLALLLPALRSRWPSRQPRSRAAPRLGHP